MTVTKRALTLVDVLVSTASIGVVTTILLPSLGAVTDDFRVAVSLNNLRILGTMHVAYANDWDGRQWTTTPDNLSEIITRYPRDYENYKDVPPVILGFDENGDLHQTFDALRVQQLWSPLNCSHGNFRMWNGRPFHNYANGKAYDPLFWAPRQLALPDERYQIIKQYFELDAEWPADAESNNFTIKSPTYSQSAAAMVDPGVYRGELDGGAQRALNIPLGHKTPNLANARYPDLKTHMLEHYWLNPPPNDPFIPNTNKVPWFFNMSDRAEPATLFYDGSVRLLPNMEVLESNHAVRSFGGGDPLWSCDIACFGCDGYFKPIALPPSNLRTWEFIDRVPSHHVFTKNGILGRDTIFNE